MTTPNSHTSDDCSAHILLGFKGLKPTYRQDYLMRLQSHLLILEGQLAFEKDTCERVHPVFLKSEADYKINIDSIRHRIAQGGSSRDIRILLASLGRARTRHRDLKKMVVQNQQWYRSHRRILTPKINQTKSIIKECTGMFIAKETRSSLVTFLETDLF